MKKTLRFCAAAMLASFALFAAEKQEGDPPPPKPFEAEKPREESIGCEMTLSDGRALLGEASLAAGKQLELFVEAEKKWKKFSLAELKAVEVAVEKEWMAKVEKWKDGGSDEKEYTGEEYPCRLYSVKVTTADSKTFEGRVLGAVIYLKDGEKKEKFLIQKNAKGEAGRKPDSLVYLKKLETLSSDELEKRKKEIEKKDAERNGKGEAGAE